MNHPTSGLYNQWRGVVCRLRGRVAPVGDADRRLSGWHGQWISLVTPLRRLDTRWSPATEASRIGGCLDFDGVGDHLITRSHGAFRNNDLYTECMGSSGFFERRGLCWCPRLGRRLACVVVVGGCKLDGIGSAGRLGFGIRTRIRACVVQQVHQVEASSCPSGFMCRGS